ncbi:MAG: hypothetical protein KDK65_07575, partial [Chlamydiia bacterium]|nr:hypothetical protein [Chlamydiia bacterium]
MGSPVKPLKTRLISGIIVLGCMGGALFLSLKASETTQEAVVSVWEPYSPARLAELQSQGVPV